MSASQPAPSPSSEMGTLVGSPAQSPRPQSLFARLSDRQVGWLVVLVGLLLYIPFAGTYGLWDPWETHYGEVARQMTKRGDFISLWWPGSPRDGAGFWSKPVLTFWLISLGMKAFGIGGKGGPPDEMVVDWKAEWALRLPFCLLAVVALWALYMVVARFVGRRAGFLAALVMATCPMFSLVARQAMTDMPFVAPMVLALALGALALLDERDEVLPRRGRGLLSWPHHSSFYVTIGLFALLTLPQLYFDSVDLRVRIPIGGRDLTMYGAVAMIPYYIGFLATIFFAARLKYRAPLYLTTAAMMCGLAVLAKGLAGLGLPVIVFLAYLAFTWNWKRLSRAQILPGLGVAVLALLVVAVPWHHAMFIRHGMPWWNELFGDNHWRRMVLGRHGDRGTFEYFLRELGYATLPWLTITPAALVAVVTRKGADSPGAARRQAIHWLGAIWFVAAYAVVSNSMTKFHHYILPAMPGLAIVLGCFIDDLWERRDARRGLLSVLVGLPLLALVVHDLTAQKSSAQLFLWLFSYDYVYSPQGRPWPEELSFQTPLIVFGVAFALFSAFLGVRKLLRVGVVGLGLTSVVFTWFLLDVYMRSVAPYWSQKYGIAEYYKHRRSPDERLVAYMMYWRGETFYTKNEIYEGPEAERTVFDLDAADDNLTRWLGAHRGRRVYFMFEHVRQEHLKGLLPAETRQSFTVIYKQNNKFAVAYADI